RTNKRPDGSLGHVATPLVATQIAGPSNGGATLTATRPALRQSTDDPTGDALASYSLTTPGTPVPPTPTNEAAGDFTSAAVGPDAATGGFTVTLKVASLAQAALTKALADTGSQSLLWVWRFTNGYTDSAASAAWSPAGCRGLRAAAEVTARIRPANRSVLPPANESSPEGDVCGSRHSAGRRRSPPWLGPPSAS